MKIEIGQQVESAKNGVGVISKIITKSTGYVEIIYSNGLVKKEMMKGLNTAPKTYIPRFINGVANPEWNAAQNTASAIAKTAKQSAFNKTRASWENEYGTTNWEVKNNWIEERERIAMATKSF